MNEEIFVLTEEESRMLDLLRKMGYGELSVLVENGVPVSVTEMRQSVLLDSTR